MMRTPSRVLAIDWSGDKQNARRKILGMSACGLVVFMPSLASGLFGAFEDVASAQVRDNPQSLTPKTQSQRPLDPMNRPMEELGVTGHDTTLCSDRQATRPGLPVADDQGMAAGVACVTVLLPVLLHFDLQGSQNHAAGPFSSQLVQRRRHRLFTPLRSLLRSDYRHHRRASPRPASRCVRVLFTRKGTPPTHPRSTTSDYISRLRHQLFARGAFKSLPGLKIPLSFLPQPCL